MKVRIKFEKVGPVKFVGHLDTMRYFQKAVRRADLPASFTGGYSPHMIMSFASPLGVGTESRGDYFDMELREELPTAEIEKRLEKAMAEGFHIVSARKVEDKKAGNAMSLVAAADYLIQFRPGKVPAFLTETENSRKEKDGEGEGKGEGEGAGKGEGTGAEAGEVSNAENITGSAGLQKAISAFLSQPEILITKETKKGESQVDIRPRIYRMEAVNGVGTAAAVSFADGPAAVSIADGSAAVSIACMSETLPASDRTPALSLSEKPGDASSSDRENPAQPQKIAGGASAGTDTCGIFCRLASSSADYTQPGAVMDAFVRFFHEEPQPFAFTVTRLELYARKENGEFVSLESLGEEV